MSTTNASREAVPSATETPLASLLAKTVQPAGTLPSGLLLGQIVAFSDGSVPLVDCPSLAATGTVPAASVVPLDTSHIGRRVAMMRTEGRSAQLVILGLMAIEPKSAPAPRVASTEVRIDGQTIAITADKDITLRCGKSSLTLTRAGKVIINGAYVSSNSTGANRIRGGSVQIN